MKFKEIIERLGDLASENSLDRDSALNPDIEKVAAIDRAQAEHLSYIEGDKFASMVGKTLASALILPQNDTLKQQASARNIAWIATPQPRLVFAKAIALFYQPYRPNPGIHPTAIIAPSVVIGKDVFIGAYAVIEQGVVIGDRVCIHPQVTIYPEAVIGENTILHLPRPHNQTVPFCTNLALSAQNQSLLHQLQRHYELHNYNQFGSFRG